MQNPDEPTIDETQNLDGSMDNTVSRRAFGRRMITAGALGTAAVMVGGAPTDAVAQSGITDTDILNFALNLEYLEAEFYTVITTGKRLKDIGIATSGTGTAGLTTGGQKVPLAPALKAIFDEIAYDEQQHVLFLRQALGSAAVAKPPINLAGVMAPHFDADSVIDALVMARAFEDVGVSAYGGAARFITNRNILEAAARIALTEGEHAGNIRLLVAQQNISTFALDEADRIPPPSGTMYFSVSQKALAKVRTPSQVLAILYQNRRAGTNRGGLFPNGLNGTIRTV